MSRVHSLSEAVKVRQHRSGVWQQKAQQKENVLFYVAVNKSGESRHLSRLEFGRLAARIWDLELSADVGQQLPVPPEMISSLRPEPAPQSDTQQSVVSGPINIVVMFVCVGSQKSMEY